MWFTDTPFAYDTHEDEEEEGVGSNEKVTKGMINIGHYKRKQFKIYPAESPMSLLQIKNFVNCNFFNF